LSHPCKCGENNYACLDFHHNSGNKEKNISRMVNGSSSLQTIQNEMEKCIVVCSNCHRKIHNKENQILDY